MRNPLLVLFFVCMVQSVAAKISAAEKDALIVLYKHTKGANWTTSWDMEKSVTTWKGVHIENESVVGLSLMNNNLEGTLPEAIGDLKKLKVLNLAFNTLQGPLPNRLLELKNLTVLRLGKNRFTGTLPKEIGKLKKLTILDLYSNALEGSLPESLGSCLLYTSPSPRD